MTDMDYTGAGQIELWQNGTQLVNWTGAVGYNPSTIPYNPPTGLSDPNQKFDVFLGPYRPTQNTQQEEFFDEARWADTYADAVPIPQAEVVLSSSSALTVPTDGDIGGSLSSGLSFSGGSLSATSSFTSGRAITVASTGGTVNVAPGTTFGIGNSLVWSGGTLKVTNTGTMSIAQTSGTVSVSSGSVLNVAAGSHAVVGGSVDPFTDSVNSSNHVAIVNNGTFTVADVNSTIAGITGAGILVVGDGTKANTLKLADNSGVSTVDSLSLLGNSALDIGNNSLIINYSGESDPIASIATWIKNGFDRLAGPAIISSDVTTDDAVSGLSYGIGYADGADGVVAGLPSGEIEIMLTLLGDANLDGTVNTEDFTRFSNHLGQSGTGWDNGDFNYDGTVNAEDFTLFSHNLGQSASLADQAGVLQVANGVGLASVPEPASAGAMMAAMIGLFARRRRRAIQAQ
jgi:Dockerin type I domain/PEP-CTERM motif